MNPQGLNDVQSDKKKESSTKTKSSFASKMKEMFGKKKEKEKVSERPVNITAPAKQVCLSDYFDVPPTLKKCIDYLDQEKYLEMDCYSTTFSHAEVQKIQVMFETSSVDDIVLQSVNPNDLSGYLRRWFRNLKEPLFSYSLYDRWIAAQAIDDLETKIEEIRNLTQALNTSHFLCMLSLFSYLRRLLLHSNENGLNGTTIGFMWQPNLIRNDSQGGMEVLRLHNDGALTGSLVTVMIEHFDDIFTEDYFPSPLMANPQTDLFQSESPNQSPNSTNPLTTSENGSEGTTEIEPSTVETKPPVEEEGPKDSTKLLAPLSIPKVNPTLSSKNFNSVPNTPQVYSPVGQPPNGFPASNPTTPVNIPTKGQLVVINGYTFGFSICDYIEKVEGRLNFMKDEKIWVTKKHDDGWWEGWKSGSRGFFPAQYIVEFRV